MCGGGAEMHRWGGKSHGWGPRRMGHAGVSWRGPVCMGGQGTLVGAVCAWGHMCLCRWGTLGRPEGMGVGC